MLEKIDPARPGARAEFIALLAGLMALNALAIDIMLPALPNMAEALSVQHDNQQQWVISSYLLGFGLFQIVWGPITDHFGRRRPLMVGVLIYLATAALAGFAPSYGTLLILRLIQGAGAASTRVIAQSVVRDKFAGRGMAEVMSLIQMIFMSVPIIAPSVGQLILFAGPWEFIFLGMATMAAAMLVWSFLRLPETLAPQNKRALTFKVIGDGFRLVFSDRIAMSYTIATSFLFGGLLSYINLAQQTYVDVYRLGPWFPLAFACTAIGLGCGSLLNSIFVRRFGMRRITHSGIIVYFTAALLLFLVSLLSTPPIWLFVLCVGSCLFVMGGLVANMLSLAMERLGTVAGSGSAVFGSIHTAMGALIGLFIGQQFDGSVSPMALGMAACAIAAFAAAAYAERGRLFAKDPEEIAPPAA